MTTVHAPIPATTDLEPREPRSVRPLSALAMLLAPWGFVVANTAYMLAIRDGGNEDTSLDTLALYAAHPDLVRLAVVGGLVACLLVVPAVLGLFRLAPSSRLVRVGGSLMIAGYICYFAVLSSALTTLAMAEQGEPALFAKALDAAQGEVAGIGIFALFVLGNLVGTLLLADRAAALASGPGVGGRRHPAVAGAPRRGARVLRQRGAPGRRRHHPGDRLRRLRRGPAQALRLPLRQLEPAQRVEVLGQVLLLRAVRRLGGVHDPAGLGEVARELGDVGGVVVVRVGHRAGLVVRHLVQAHGRFDGPVAVPPQAGRGLEAVVAEQPPAVAREHQHGLDEVVDDPVVDEVVEVHPHPAGLDALAAAGDLPFELVRTLEVDVQQPVAVGAGARTAAPRLDAEQVVEHGDDVVVVEVLPARRAHHEADDREPARVEVAEDLDAGLVLPRGHRPLQQGLLVLLDGGRPDGGLQLEDQAGADGLHDRGRAALLAVLRVVVVAVLDRVDVHHRAAAGHDGDAVAHQLAADHQHAGSAGPADELVRRKEDRVLVRRRVDTLGARTSRCRRTARTPRSPRTTGHRGRAAATRCRRCRRRSRSRCWRPRTSRSSGAGRRTSRARRAARRGRCDRRRPRGWSPRRRSTRAMAARWSGARKVR